MESVRCLHSRKLIQLSMPIRPRNPASFPLRAEKQSNWISQNEFDIFKVSHYLFYNSWINWCRASWQYCHQQVVARGFSGLRAIRAYESWWENSEGKYRNQQVPIHAEASYYGAQWFGKGQKRCGWNICAIPWLKVNLLVAIEYWRKCVYLHDCLLAPFR